MKILRTTMLAGLAAAAVTMAVPAFAADLLGGSLKDDPVSVAPSRASCYVRGDVGYGWSSDSDASYVGNTDNGGNPYEAFDATALTDAAFGEVGLGCGRGVRGLRADVTFGWHREKEFEGHIPINTNPDDPIYTSLQTLTSMVNVYYDMGDWGGFVPYLGAGIGAAMHDMDYVHSTDPSSPNPQFGDTKIDLAWQVSAGVGYQLTEGVTFDLGYRYLSLGDAHSSNLDDIGFWNPMLQIHDIGEHEIKAGIRLDLSSWN